MTVITDVLTGEVKSAGVNTVLRSSAIGSCIVVAAYYPQKLTGAMAHIMLPGKASEKKEANRFRYAENAINELLLQLRVTAKRNQKIHICLIGAGNVLKREDDLICKKNTESVLDILNLKKLKVEAQALGGTRRRSARLDIARGEIYYTENGSGEMLLWKNGGDGP